MGVNPQSPLISAPSLKVSSNRFSSLISVSSEYIPLAYIDVEVSYPGKEDWIVTRALIDCGGQGNFVNEEFSKENLIPHLPKSIPIALVLTNGECSDRGPITRFNPVILKTGRNVEPIGLDIATVAHDIILGKSWLNKNDPTIR